MPTRRQVVMGLVASTTAQQFGTNPALTHWTHAAGRTHAMSQATPTTGTPAAGRPTVALVHGAFADSSGWLGVIAALERQDIAVVAISNPLRGIAADAAYVASRVQAIAGPVVLVGHSYGGAVITSASDAIDNVAGLVYIAAYAPDEGETLGGIGAQFTDNLLGPALVPATVPVAGSTTETQQEFSIAVDQFHAVFAADLSEETAHGMALTQRPIADTAFGEPMTVPGWKTLPSWFAVATADQAIGPSAERFMAERAGGTTIELDGSHVVFISQPDAVADLIATAVNTVG